MNKRIISACMNPGIDIEKDIEKVIVKEVIDEYLKCDEVVYDGNVISAYDMYSLINDKMNYIKDMCDFDNYVFNQDEVNKKLGKGFKFDYWSNIKINKDKSLFFEFTHPMYEKQLGFNVYLNDNDISYKLKHYFSKKYNYSGNYLDGYFYNSKYVTLSYDKAEEFIKVFINDNREILFSLLTIINDLDVYSREYDQKIYGSNYKLYFKFNLTLKNVKVYLYFADSKGNSYKSKELGLNDYVLNNMDELFKRIGVNMDELNSFYKNEVDNYYNSINLVDYKCYRRKK